MSDLGVASESKTHLDSIEYPKTAIIAITTDGFIKTDDESPYNAITFNVPDGLSIIKYSEVPVDVCSFFDSESITNYVQFIKTKCDSIDSIETADDKKIFIETQIGSVFKKQTDMFVDYIKKHPDESSEPEKHIQLLKYYKLGNKTNIFKSGEAMVNKGYFADKTDYASIVPNHNHKILLLNADQMPDLFDKVKVIDRGLELVNLEDLVLFLKDRGVECVVVFDFTCNETGRDHGDNEEEFINITTKILGGKRMKPRKIIKRHTRKQKSTRRKTKSSMKKRFNKRK